jgi:hypothetical protein
MEKEFKDYHLYLGCDVLLINDISEDYGDDSYDPPAINSIGKLSLINEGDFQINGGEESEGWPYGVTFENCHIALWDLKDFKLLLRPLSDMTEEEKENIQGTDWGFLETNYDWEFSPETFIYLLSKYFDLFGLIEAGLAIDKTKLPA